MIKEYISGPNLMQSKKKGPRELIEVLFNVEELILYK
jgi:hypothetical protein